ncbi:XRE family transcriptional regulator [Vibrio parahaemolyticus]|nr:helix-turn-helix transcriptional regulator [Vibrio parahaemolyticus]MCZ5859990.1 helix-turn-helix transcriptional regulator [Vibrio parahaemolyticus]MCZ6278751.1 helix-turn-helix transcriptional regulator [Vibrio parahaemolyticus]MDF4423299.1 helix-turn-helix transcriptional regulator [Vibrio parahaemolyticus]MDF4619780.1 helix-turn-helix transcriptional regulator [Vibrio parahaemolyticus]MDF5494766.1 helix-turn-helix transcriptional regulator [Vibrio parahaemolyticus]
MNEDKLLSFGDRVRKARAMHSPKLNQYQLAERAGLKQSTISRIEKGDFQGTAKLVELAAALNVSPIWLSTGEGDMKPQGGDEHSELQRLSHAVQRLGLNREQVEELVNQAIIIATKMI